MSLCPNCTAIVTLWVHYPNIDHQGVLRRTSSQGLPACPSRTIPLTVFLSWLPRDLDNSFRLWTLRNMAQKLEGFKSGYHPRTSARRRCNSTRYQAVPRHCKFLKKLNFDYLRCALQMMTPEYAQKDYFSTDNFHNWIRPVAFEAWMLWFKEAAREGPRTASRMSSYTASSISQSVPCHNIPFESNPC